MKSKLFMYLFIFSLLTAIFIYVNSKNILNKYEVDITRLKEQQIRYKDSINTLYDKNLNLRYFNLEGNEDALSYFETNDIDTDGIENFIKEQLYTLNESEDKGQFIPYESIDGKMIINKVRLLNHKWIIADFSDGEYWGELFINYAINPVSKAVSFKVTDSFIYPPTRL